MPVFSSTGFYKKHVRRLLFELSCSCHNRTVIKTGIVKNSEDWIAF